MSAILTKLKNKYIDLRGYHTDRKLVVIESDDWGSIRMPSKTVFEHLKSIGDAPDKDAFLSNDSLESESDLLALFEVLESVVDGAGNHPIITANFAVANPDFDKIDYENGVYAYEPFYLTYDRYYGEGNRVLELIRDGYERALMLPQLHCREHLNVNRWMRDLQNGTEHTRLAFENKTMGVGASFGEKNIFGYMDAFNTDLTSHEELGQILADAHRIFVDAFGFSSKTFVASCFVWADALESALKDQGIYYIQSSPWQNKPIGRGGDYQLKRKLRYAGQKNRLGQIYGVRNCNYEPAYYQNPKECAKECLAEIDSAFAARKPAVISSHRLNYIGSINPENRDNNLMGLKELLYSVVQKYPEVEFVSSAQLFSIISKE